MPVRPLLLALALLTSTAGATDRPPWGTGESRGEDLEITLVTFGPGDDVASWFGHTALAVRDGKHRHARLYNYGMFDFRKFGRFALGRLEFWVGEQQVEGTLRWYQSLDRDVRIQVLNLTPEARLAMAKALADNVLPQNRDYLYHHYYDNCATRPRDAIDRAVGGQLRAFTEVPGRMTLRDHTRRYASVSPPMSVLLDFLMNDEIDRPIRRWDEAFLPAELEAQVAALRYVDTRGEKVPLVASASVFYRSTREPIPDEVPRYAPWLLLLGLGLGAVPFGLLRLGATSRRGVRVLFGGYQALLGLAFGLPGLVLTIMWIVTDHTVTFRNENLLLSNPLLALALPFGLMWMWGSARALSWLPRIWLSLSATGLLGVLLKALPWFDQDNWRLVALLLPVSVGNAAALWLEARRRKGLAPPRGS